MDGLVKKTIQGLAVLGVLGLGSCDSGEIADSSGREPGNVAGITYGRENHVQEGISGPIGYRERNIPCRRGECDTTGFVLDTLFVQDTITIPTLFEGDTLTVYRIVTKSLDLEGGDIEGVNKINVNVVDPVYNIGGEKYSTFAPSMVGLKEEASGRVMLDRNNRYEIDFNSLPRGSDLWLLHKITDFGPDMENLQVMLTPGFDGRVWYEKNPGEDAITIFGSSAGEVSYRFTANRFDWRNWLFQDLSGVKGIDIRKR